MTYGDGMTYDAMVRRLLVLRAEREGLLLKDRATKARPAHKRRYREVVIELNTLAETMRRRR